MAELLTHIRQAGSNSLVESLSFNLHWNFRRSSVLIKTSLRCVKTLLRIKHQNKPMPKTSDDLSYYELLDKSVQSHTEMSMQD